MAALAAFLRIRIAAARAATSLDLRGARLGVTRLLEGAETLIAEDPEGGRRGQALVGAAFDLAFGQVRTGRVNDPSRKHPGDVQAMEGVKVLLAAEVRQKHVAEVEVLQFAAALRDGDVANGVLVALHPTQAPLPREDILQSAEHEYGVLMSVIEGSRELLLGALMWSGRPLEALLTEFPHRMLERMEEIEVSEAGQARWVALFADPL